MKRDQVEPAATNSGESGVTLPFVALLLLVLLGIAAFATDLAWFYLNASRIQRAADAGSLAGVVWMPSDFPQATVTANEITTTNGYVNGVDNAIVEVAPVAGKPSQLDVTITDTVPTFFLQVFGMSQQTIVRKARAEYVPPLPMGSPDNQFGNACDPLQPGCTGQPNFWANIHGRYTDNELGDAYSSACTDHSGSPCGSFNPLWDEATTAPGYLYGVERAGPGVPFSIEFTDVEFHNSSGGVTNGDHVRTGDNGCPSLGGDTNAGCGPTMIVSLYAPDPDPLDLTNNTLLCTANISPQPQVDPSVPYHWQQFGGCFTVNNPQAGIYVVQVRVASVGPDPDGLNRYSVRSTPGSRIYAIDNMSIYNNATSLTTDFYLAEVSPIYAGKTFVVEMYDVGESNDPGELQVMDPSGSVWTGPCEVSWRDEVTDPWIPLGTPPTCSETVNPQEYHTDWLKFEVDLPPTYTCTSCWWKMNYDYAGVVQDTTTWRAYILGNPIHLIPHG
jgi:hypothetical protein